MRLVKILSIVAFSLCGLAARAAAQEARCTLTAESAPEVRGLRLGMSMEQLRARFPGARFGEERFGLVYSHLDQSVLQSGEGAGAFQGVGELHLHFVDGRLRKFSLNYLNTVRWESNEQFAARVSESLKLPAAWKAASNGGLEMGCPGFAVNVRPNSISFTETDAFDVVERRKKEKQESDRRSFKP